MTEKDTFELYLPKFPTEILIQIFTYLPVKKLFDCRLVCVRWKDIVDCMITKDSLWKRYCMYDYTHMYLQTKYKGRSEINFYDLYKAFSLWSKLDQTVLVQNEFALASRVDDEITSFILLPEGVIGVHTRGAIVYYNLKTLSKINTEVIQGRFVRYDENEQATVLLNEDQLLFIMLKIFRRDDCITHVTLEKATHFILLSDRVYYVINNSEIYVCNFHNNLSCTYINSCKEDIVCLGYKDDTLYFATYKRNIYEVSGTKLVITCTLMDSYTILHLMSKYNLLVHFNWHVYSHWKFSLSHTVLEEPLRTMVVIHLYGDVIFIGTMWGILRIYYASYTNGVLNINHRDPVKEFSFVEPDACPAQFYCPIMHIEVVEGIEEHTVLIAMPRKMVILKFLHNFREETSIAEFSLMS